MPEKEDTNIKKLNDIRIIFKDYCNNQQKNNKYPFKANFEEKFKDFIDISKSYNLSITGFDEGKIIYKEKGLLSGFKVSEKDKMCFVQVNTEWLYELGKYDSKIMHYVGGSVEDISSFMKIDENCCLCAPLIKEVYFDIKKNYPEYTVVTVMHRWIDHLSWGERNKTDSSQIDAIRYIRNGSDIIITGHDHIIHPMPPTLLDNHVQHFQLGSVGRPESFSEELSRFAEIIRLDSNNGIIEQLFIQHQSHGSRGSYWNFIPPDGKSYPLYNKFSTKVCNKFPEKSPKYENLDAVLKARSSNESDIKEAIEGYFNKNVGTEIHCLKAENGIKRKIDNIIHNIIQLKRLGNTCHIVVYYLYPEYNNKSKGIKLELDEYRDDNISKFLKGEIIINEVVVEYPDWEQVGEFPKPYKTK